MTTFQTDQQVIYFSEKFGLITNNQVILTINKKQNKIRIDSIAKVSLVKHRVFYVNTLLFFISISVFALTYAFYDSEKMELYLGFGALGILIFVYSVIQKFYSYKIVIKEKDRSVVELRTNQFNRKGIKEFYSTIIKHVPKN